MYTQQASAPQAALDQTDRSRGQVFVPFYDELVQSVGVLGELVPFDLDYQCVRLLDGTYEFFSAPAKN